MLGRTPKGVLEGGRFPAVEQPGMLFEERQLMTHDPRSSRARSARLDTGSEGARA
jgi:hypothetical protein